MGVCVDVWIDGYGLITNTLSLLPQCQAPLPSVEGPTPSPQEEVSAALNVTPPPTSPPAKDVEALVPVPCGAGVIADTEETAEKEHTSEQQPTEPNPAEVAPVTPVLGYVLKQGVGEAVCNCMRHLLTHMLTESALGGRRGCRAEARKDEASKAPCVTTTPTNCPLAAFNGLEKAHSTG